MATFVGRLVIPDDDGRPVKFDLLLCAQHWHEAIETLGSVFVPDPFDLMAQTG